MLQPLSLIHDGFKSRFFLSSSRSCEPSSVYEEYELCLKLLVSMLHFYPAAECVCVEVVVAYCLCLE